MNLDVLYSRLSDADAAQDPDALATLAWELYGELGTVQAQLDSARARLRQVTDVAA
jgi:hypothetical protein